MVLTGHDVLGKKCAEEAGTTSAVRGKPCLCSLPLVMMDRKITSRVKRLCWWQLVIMWLTVHLSERLLVGVRIRTVFGPTLPQLVCSTSMLMAMLGLGPATFWTNYHLHWWSVAELLQLVDSHFMKLWYVTLWSCDTLTAVTVTRCSLLE